MAQRKKTRVYAFGGHITKLEERIARCKSKLADPSDPDDKRWLSRWLKAAETRIAKKERSMEAKAASGRRPPEEMVGDNENE
jgi:hypothetical protein